MTVHVDERAAKRDAARQKANHVRSTRAAVKGRLKEARDLGETRTALSAIVTNPAPELATVLLVDALAWGKGIGQEGARYLARRAKVDGARRLGELADIERQRLVFVLQTVSFR